MKFNVVNGLNEIGYRFDHKNVFISFRSPFCCCPSNNIEWHTAFPVIKMNFQFLFWIAISFFVELRNELLLFTTEETLFPHIHTIFIDYIAAVEHNMNNVSHIEQQVTKFRLWVSMYVFPFSFSSLFFVGVCTTANDKWFIGAKRTKMSME